MMVMESRQEPENSESRKEDGEKARPILAHKQTNTEDDQDQRVNEQGHGEEMAETGDESLKTTAFRGARGDAGSYATGEHDSERQ